MKFRIYNIIQNQDLQHKINCMMPSECPIFDGSEVDIIALGKLEFEILKSPGIISDFFYLTEGVFIFNQKVYDSDLYTSFEFACQIVELNVTNTDENIYCANITNSVNIVDVNNTIFGTTHEDGEKQILKHVFKPNRISTLRSLLKLAQNGSRASYCLSPGNGNDFYKDYKKSKANGLLFEEVAVFKQVSRGGDWVLEY